MSKIGKMNLSFEDIHDIVIYNEIYDNFKTVFQAVKISHLRKKYGDTLAGNSDAYQLLCAEVYKRYSVDLQADKEHLTDKEWEYSSEHNNYDDINALVWEQLCMRYTVSDMIALAKQRGTKCIFTYGDIMEVYENMLKVNNI